MNSPSRRRILKHFKTQIQVFKKQLAQTHRDPSPEHVHQLRITTRRIRAVIWLAQHGSPALSFGKLAEKLHDLGQLLGELRELDVAIRDAGEFQLKNRELNKRRRVARKNLVKRIGPKQRKKLTAKLADALVALENHQEQSMTRALDLMGRRILPWTSQTAFAQNDFHRARIMAKKTRYILETLGRPVRPLRRLQDVLGKGHDLEVLQELSARNAQIQNAAKKQYRKAVPLIRPALSFALDQLRAEAGKESRFTGRRSYKETS